VSIQDQPHNPDAERAVIAGALRRADAPDLYALEPGDFFLASHQQIYRSILSTRHADTLSIVAVADDLRRRGELERIGGMSTLLSLPSDAWTPSYETDECAAIVRRCAIRRAMIAAGGRIVTMGYQEHVDLDDQIGEAHALLTSATTRASTQSGVAIGDALDAWYDMATSDDGDGARLSTGLVDLDDLTGGVWCSDLVVLAAATGVGKSALALSIADHLTCEGALVVWFSMEMPRAQLINRLVAGYTRIDAARLRKRRIKPSEMPAIAQAMTAYRERNLIIDDTPGRTMAQVRAVTQQHRARRGAVGLVVVDHMGLMRASTRYAGNRVHEVSELSRGLKELAMELRAPVLALHQFNRGGSNEDDPTRVPLLSGLKDSSSVEQDADSVWLLHRPGVRSSDPAEQTKATLYVAKQRNGPIGAVQLHYDPTTTQYRSVDRYRSPEGY
jgi:replicative DNA helicase